MSEYLERIVDVLQRIEAEEAAALSSASDAVADVICRDGIIHVFGCGHSHAAKSSRMEKMPGIASEVYRRHGVKQGDLFVVISASGKNAAPVEMLHAAKAAGVKTVAISSSAYRPHGGVLLDEADIAVDCKVPHGDAVIDVGEAKMGGLSTYASLFILNTALIEGAKKALARGVTPPVYTSGNVDGGTARNVALEERYFGRVKHL